MAHGQAVAEAVGAWAMTDGFAALHDCPSTPPVGPGLWEPTPPTFAPPLEPCWGQLRPLALASSEACAPPPYAEDPASEFFARALDVYTTNVHLTEEQRTIAHFGADISGTMGTPPGHWVAIMGQRARHKRVSLITAAEDYVRVGLASVQAFRDRWSVRRAPDGSSPLGTTKALHERCTLICPHPVSRGAETPMGERAVWNPRAVGIHNFPFYIR